MIRRSVLMAVALSLPLLAHAGEAPETPQQLKGGKVISVEEASKLAQGKGVTFVDTRSVINFGKGHVPGAVTAAYKEKSEKVENFDASVDSFDFAKIPADKSAKIVFYSDGPTGWKSYKASVLAIQKGHTNVMYMRGGFAEWTAKSLPVER
jgi:rhodanese-related sulfurtransferase